MTKYKWNVLPLDIDNGVQTVAKDCHLKLGIAAMLKQRNFKTPNEVKTLLDPNKHQFRDPFLLHDMAKACNRIMKAIENHERITVYGDYDADGITSTTIMYETIQILGGDVHYFIPDRFIDGYGPNVKRFTEICQQGTRLIITVDNGIVGFDSIDQANQLGCDVIVTDHHEMGAHLPNSYATVYATYPGDEYPFDDFCGAGIAFKVSCALLKTIPMELIGLAAIGTIADVVSVTDENRIIVSLGLKQLQHTTRPGLRELLKTTGLYDKDITAQDLGFKLCPKFNALGRIGNAKSGVELLTTIDLNQGIQLANLCELQNTRRQILVQTVKQQALEIAKQKVNAGHHTLVIAHKGWHQGVLGIAASHVVEAFNCPTIVLTYNKDHDEYRGSGRSIEGFNLFNALDDNRDHMTSFGGHEMACGLGVKPQDLDHLQAHLDQAYAKQIGDAKITPKIDISAVLSPEKMTMYFYQEVQQLAPFGTDNEQPHFELEHCHISDVKLLGRDQQTLKLTIRTKSFLLSAIGFNMGNAYDALNQAGIVNLVGDLNLNSFAGQQTLQLLISDYEIVS